MNVTIQQEVVRRLINDFSFKEREQYLQQGVCPACHKKELFTSIEKPWMLKCGRENKCGKEILVKELYRDIFEDWSKRYQPTPETPNATAEAYLREARGLDTSKLAGCYTQGTFIKNGLGSATVKFKLANGSGWERIIDQPDRFNQKANFIGNYAGYWWEYPGLDLSEQKEIWITEGIFNAIALNEVGRAAVATLSSVNYPKALLDMLAEILGDKPRPRLIWAFDDDKAGRSHIIKFARRARDAGWDVSAALPSENGSSLDWNDLYLRERLGSHNITQYRHYGRLLLAESPAAKALEMYNHNSWRSFYFTFGFRTYWFELDFEKYSRAYDRIQELEGVFDDELAKEKAIKESGSLEEIANCVMQPLYYQVSKPTDEAWYYLRVMAPNMPTVKSTFTASQLTSSAEFKKRLLHMAKGALFTGTTKQLDIIFRSLQNIKEVNTMNWLGFNKDHNAWIFNDVAISKGRVFTLNEEDYFDIEKLSIKSLSMTPSLNLNVDLRDFDTSWANDIWTAFGTKGYVALAFWLGSFFAEQLRQRNKSYPFLEIVGEPGTGKSTLIEFLWKLCGREDYEGFDPSKSTAAARGRNFSQVANLPVVLIEGDRQSIEGKTKNLRAFDYDELKSLYNGRASRALGIKTNNNETYEPPFKGAIVIAQNADVDGSEALLSRLIHIATDRSGQTPETTAAAARLEQMPVKTVSGFLIKATSMADILLAEYDKHLAIAQQQFKAQGIIKTNRISLNHAQIQALLAVLPMVVPVPPERIQECWKYVITLAEERQRALNQDHPLVQEFWEMFDYLDSQESAGMNHSSVSEPNEIAVNFNHFEEIAAHYRQRLNFTMVDIKKLLKHGTKRKYLRTCSVRSDVSKSYNLGKETTYRRPETYYCWIFSREK
ncbi:toprim domain-containing protein [Citrobacter freundii]|uniref:toprim domain-containing protein n=1 Tax=Citrobacter freundii TaxID=546 RepID=UPI001FF46739|nr:toprim domain-containing protein [Citrobacter freundii]EKX5204213.1 toprim domain-containing protein [Citrobacter freundii]MCJ8533293.1 toprim domain-containing protein [Citrobacter freundii]HCB1818426.1 toprim domain-containing protein [Citrobacter freundii]